METLGLLKGQAGQGPLGDLGDWVYRESKEGKGPSSGEKRGLLPDPGPSPGPETTGGQQGGCWCWGRKWACWFPMARA